MVNFANFETAVLEIEFLLSKDVLQNFTFLFFECGCYLFRISFVYQAITIAVFITIIGFWKNKFVFIDLSLFICLCEFVFLFY